MKILIVSATPFEVQPLMDFLGIGFPAIGMNRADKKLDKDIHILITGVGMVSTAFMMGRHADSSFDMIINSGVCGAFDKNLKLGELVHISEDILSELGAEDGDNFLTYDNLSLKGEHVFKEKLSQKIQFIDSLKNVKGITVNTVHGKETSIDLVKKLYNPDVESMEGAAFFASCTHDIKNYIQIRAISNYIEPRDKSKWEMPLAIKNLNDYLIKLLNNL